MPDLVQSVKFDYDYGEKNFGGPIKRDRAWFFVQGRNRGIKEDSRRQRLACNPNLNEDKWGYNYQPDR